MWYLLDLVIHARAYPTFSKINCQYLWERLSYFVYLLLVVTHPGKLQCYHVVLEQYGPACPNFSEITNRQYLWRGWVILLTFCKYLLASCWISIEATKICYFGLSGNQIIRCFKLKKLENLRYQVDCLLPLKLQKISCYFGISHQMLLVNPFAGFFTFDLFDLLILILGIYCYIVLFFSTSK